jgi:hypothetical protein
VADSDLRKIDSYKKSLESGLKRTSVSDLPAPRNITPESPESLTMHNEKCHNC